MQYHIDFSTWLVEDPGDYVQSYEERMDEKKITTGRRITRSNSRETLANESDQLDLDIALANSRAKRREQTQQEPQPDPQQEPPQQLQQEQSPQMQPEPTQSPSREQQPPPYWD